MFPAPSQVGSAATKHYPNILPSLSALALLSIISLLFSKSLLRLQLLIVIDGASRKGTRGHGSDRGGRRGGRGRAAPVGAHWRGWQAWAHAQRGGRRGGCGCPFLCWQLGVPVSCLRLALSLTKGKQKGESEKEFLIREGSYRLSASLAHRDTEAQCSVVPQGASPPLLPATWGCDRGSRRQCSLPHGSPGTPKYALHAMPTCKHCLHLCPHLSTHHSGFGFCTPHQTHWRSPREQRAICFALGVPWFRPSPSTRLAA